MRHSLFTPEWRSAARTLAVVLLATAIFHVWATWPVFRQPTDLLPGWEGDNLLFLWNLSWVAYGDGPWAGGPQKATGIFFPEGFPFLFHTHTWLYGQSYRALDAVLLSHLLEHRMERLTLGYNLLMLSSSLLTALGLAGLCLAHGVRGLPAVLLPTLAGTFCGARLFAFYGHLNLVGTEFLVASALCIVLGLQGRLPGVSAWALAGVCSGLALLNSHTYGIMSAVVGILGLSALPFSNSQGGQREGTAIVAYLATLLLVSAIHVLPLASIYRSGDYMVASATEPRLFDAVNLFLPSNYNALLGRSFQDLREEWHIREGQGVGRVGWAFLFILAAGALFWRRSLRPGLLRPFSKHPLRLFWLLVGLVGALCLLGDTLMIAGRELLPLPYRLARDLAAINNLRVPERWIVLPILPLTVLAARVLERLRSTRRGTFIATAAVFAALLLVESGYTPITVRTDAGPLRLSEQTIATIPTRGGAVLSLPMSFENNRALAWQAQHGQPEVFGRLTRLPPGLAERRLRVYPFLAPMILEPEGNLPLVDDLEILAFLNAHKVRTVLYASERPQDLYRLLALRPQEFWDAAGVEFVEAGVP